jgi:periplasmic protein TonB
VASGGARTANGTSGPHAAALAPRELVGPIWDDPMDRVLGLDAKNSGLAAWFGFTSGGMLLMVALMALVSVVAWVHTVQARLESAPEEIEVLREEAPAPPPPTPPEPEVKPEHIARPVVAPAPPPQPAQAAKVLAQEPDPNEPVDLTGNTIVMGNADSYAGGMTSSNGTSTTAVRGLTSPNGVPNAAPVVAPSPPPGPDRTRPAGLAGGSEWNAPFPPEADTVQIDEAYVTLQIEVRPDGTPGSVNVIKEPGNGFGREARRYAMTQRFQPALDRAGNPIASTFVVKVHFSR